MKKSGNRQRSPRFVVGELVRITSDKHIPPEGFRPGGGFDVRTQEIPEGSLGVIVNPPGPRYVKTDPHGEIMSWVLVCGDVLEVPHFHLRRL